MKISEYKQIDTKYENEFILTVDENGIKHGKTITKAIPVMGMVTRDMTEDEEKAYLEEQKRIREEMKMMPPTEEERLSAMEDALLELLGGIE